MRVAIYDSPLGPGFRPLVWPDAVIGYVIVPEGSTFDDEFQLHVPGDARTYSAAELSTPTDAYFKGFGWLSPEAMAA